MTMTMTKTHTKTKTKTKCLKDPSYAIFSRISNMTLTVITRFSTFTEMEKRADGADASVLFFLLGCANFLAVYAQIR